MAIIDSYMVWVCIDCILHHANGECGNCHTDEGHDSEPLSRLSGEDLSMGNEEAQANFSAWWSCEGCYNTTTDDRHPLWVHVHASETPEWYEPYEPVGDDYRDV